MLTKHFKLAREAQQLLKGETVKVIVQVDGVERTSMEYELTDHFDPEVFTTEIILRADLVSKSLPPDPEEEEPEEE